MNAVSREMLDFVAGQIANANSPQAARLAGLFKEAIKGVREEGMENERAFCADAEYADGSFHRVRVSFEENCTMTVLYEQDSDPMRVQAIYDGHADDELCRLAGLMLSKGWIKGFVQ